MHGGVKLSPTPLCDIIVMFGSLYDNYQKTKKDKLTLKKEKKPIFGTIRVVFCIFDTIFMNIKSFPVASFMKHEQNKWFFCSDVFIKHFLCIELNATTYVMNKLA